MLTQQQIKENLDAIYQQGGSDKDAQSYLDSLKGVSPPTSSASQQGLIPSIARAVTGTTKSITESPIAEGIGYATGAGASLLGGVVGGATRGALGLAEGMAKHEMPGQILKRGVQEAYKGATETGKFGYETGFEGGKQSILSPLGPYPLAAIALAQGYELWEPTKEALKTGDYGKLAEMVPQYALIALATRGALKSKGAFFDPEIVQGMKVLGSAVRYPVKSLQETLARNETIKQRILDANRQTYKDIYNLSSAQERKYISGKNDMADLASREGLVFEMDGNTINIAQAVSHLQERASPLYEQLKADIAKQPVKRFHLDTWATQAKKKVDKMNFPEVDKQKVYKAIDEIVDAEKLKLGQTKSIKKQAGSLGVPMDTSVQRQNQPAGLDFVAIKEKLWNKAYESQKTKSENSAPHFLGTAAKEMIEKAYPNVAVQEINERIGQLLELKSFLQNIVNGKKVPGGKLGTMIYKIIGGIVGSTTGSPAMALASAEVAGALQRAAVNPALRTRLSARLLEIIKGETGKTPVKKKDNLVPPTTSLYGGIAGVEMKKDEEGKYKMSFSPEKAALGIGLMAGAEKGKVIFGKSKAVSELSQVLRGTKGLTAKDIMVKHPDIQLKRDVPATDIYGNKVKIPEGEALTPYELKGNKILLQDGETYIVTKNQFQNIKGHSVVAEAKEFAPELKGLEESVRGGKDEFGLIAGEPVKKNAPTKFSKNQLPGGKNYKEIILKTPSITDQLSAFGKSKGIDNIKEAEALWKKETGKSLNTSNFTSSHFPGEKNPISHLRLNERTYKGQKVTFMEEAQSDWARARRKYIEDEASRKPGEGKFTPIPSNPLVEGGKWVEPTVKRGLQEAVANDSEYFAWINGEQTSARYNLATYLEKTKWRTSQYLSGGAEKEIILNFKEGELSSSLRINKEGIVLSADGKLAQAKGKKLDEVLGKGLADSIMSKESGTLSGEGLKFGGEWANNLYDKQIKNIVEDVTGGKVEVLDMGLPIEAKEEIFDISTKTTKQMGVKLTPEIKAKIRGEAPQFQTSGKMFGGEPKKSLPTHFKPPLNKKEFSVGRGQVIKGDDQIIFRGAHDTGIETSNAKNFKKIIEFSDQRDALDYLIKKGNQEARNILSAGKTYYDNNFDKFLDLYFSQQGIDAVKYIHPQSKIRGIEYRDVKKGQSYSTLRDEAENYSLGNTPTYRKKMDSK